MMNQTTKTQSTKVELGFTFTIENKNDWRTGRTYKVTGFNADKLGNKFAICEWIEEIGFKSSHIFYQEDFLGAVEIKPQPVAQIPNLAICLNDRQDEFTEAFKRGFNNEFLLLDGWDMDEFFVVNRTNKTEYKVQFSTVDGKCYAECDCPDFIHRKRICKHLSFAFVETFFKTEVA
jgi:hypothetical protein